MKLSELLEEKGTTVYQILKKTTLSKTTVYDLVRGGTIKNSKLETVKNIADALDITLDELYNTVD